MCKMKMAVLASILVGLLLLAAMPASASAGLVGWQYQREITIQENSGETLRDYQVPVALAGSDFPGEAQPDGDDIRFTDADGRELSYWIEEFDAGSKRAAIWVKVPLIPANGEAGVMVWWGNPNAESASDGEAVFDTFLDKNSIEKWIHERNDIPNEWDIVHGDLHLYSTKRDSSKEYSVNVSSKYVIEKVEKAKYTYRFMGLDSLTSDSRIFDIYWHTCYGDEKIYWGIKAGEQETSNVHAIPNKYYKIKIIVDENSERVSYFIYDYNSGSLIISFLNKNYAHNNPRHLNYVAIVDGFGSCDADIYTKYIFIRKYASLEPTVTVTPPAPAAHTALTITKSPTPHSIHQFQETTITLSIENSGTTDATDIEITDAIHPSFDLTSGDFPNPKCYDLIRPGETRDLQYTISAKESGTFTLDPATVTYADDDGNIQEATSEPVSLKVIPSAEGSTAGGTSRSNPYVSTASVQLHGEKTSVVLGEDILLKLSAVNLITKPTMHVQVIIIPPSGMSVTSSAFAKSGAGQYTTTYELEPGTGKDIEVAIRSNQVGDFDVNGRIIYYFGDDRDAAEDHTLTLPITVRAEPEQTVDTSGSEENGSSTPGFVAVVAVIGLLAAYLRRRI